MPVVHSEAAWTWKPVADAGGSARRRSPAVIAAAVVASSIAAACCIAPLLPLAPPVGGDVLDAGLPALTPGHFLGADLNGNDLLSRALHGGRSSLLVAACVNIIGLTLGGVLGAFSAYRGGWIDAVIMRSLDVLIAFPTLVAVLALAHALGPSRINTALALSLFAIPAFARLSRASALRLCELPFVLAAELSGTGTARMLAKHLLPHIVAQLASFALLGMGALITLEGALSFLGLGIPPPHPSWGGMISQGQEALFESPLIILVPSTFLVATVLSFNLLGQSLRRQWNTL